MGKKKFLVKAAAKVKDTVAEHLTGLAVFAVKSPFLCGRYIGLEAVLAAAIIYGNLKKKHLEWVDD